ncbi:MULTISPECIES: DNA polymerase III subunit chi [Psychrobacter]|uniref:DNA polymerase III subunit chi n=1 Tax=Psychrobacter TaxID=497 RepID=UPI000EDB4FEA|nr:MULTISPECIES: DNA polymerase III subunit chi [Psychrobacter]HCH26320.1 DNA polymerase III subunit chi [Psychrobacter sp.]
MNVSFYVLSEHKAQEILGFICQLTQTALNKSSQSLLILSQDEALLSLLDEALWTHDATSFIPHQRLLGRDPHSIEPDTVESDAAKPDTSDIDEAVSAPVMLGSYMPADFSGIVLNTTLQPVSDFIAATSPAKPTRILELIKPDAKSMQEGRHKYKHYKQLGYELTHYTV